MINKKEGRSGSLFLKNFKRLQIENEEYFKRLIYYIHHNPQRHEICEDFKSYKYSSYQALISKDQTLLAREDFLNFFNSREELINFHDYLYDESVIENFIIE